MQELVAVSSMDRNATINHDGYLDTTKSVLQAKEEFSRIQAQLRKIVASREDYISEIHEGQPTEHFIYEGIGVNLKIRIHENPAPLTVMFYYPDNPSIKGVRLYHSQQVKEPKTSEARFSALNKNPTKIKVNGIIDSRTGKQVFNNHWLYITMVCDKDAETRVRINFRFNKPIVHASKKKLALKGNPDQQAPDGEQPEDDEDNKTPVSSKKVNENEIDIDNFTLGEGPLRAKREKLNKLKDKLVEDDALRIRLSKKIQNIRMEQAKNIKQMELGVNSNPNIEMLDRMYNASISQHQGYIQQMLEENFDFMNQGVDKGAIIQRNITLAPFYRDYNK